RFLNMGVEPYNFVSALNCILAQRLVRLICNSCRNVVKYPADVMEASGLDPEQWSKVSFYEGQGCIECAGTGFRGRTAIHELLDFMSSYQSSRPKLACEIAPDRIIAGRAADSGQVLELCSTAELSPGCVVADLTENNLRERNSVVSALRETLSSVAGRGRDV